MQRVAIVSPLRTPVGGFGGALAAVPAEELGATVARAIVERTRLDPARIDDVVFAQSYMNGEAPCTGRWVALQAASRWNGWTSSSSTRRLRARCSPASRDGAAACRRWKTG